MTWRKRQKNERKHFNKKLEDSLTWHDKFHYPFISEIIEVCLPKVNVSGFLTFLDFRKLLLYELTIPSK